MKSYTISTYTKIFISATIGYFSFFNPTLAGSSPTMRENFNRELTSGQWKVEKYYSGYGATNENYRLFYKNKKLRMVQYKEHDSSAGDTDINYTAFYNVSGSLEYAYYKCTIDGMVEENYKRGVVFGKDIKSGDKKFSIARCGSRFIFYEIGDLYNYIDNSPKRINSDEFPDYARIFNITVKFHYPGSGERTLITGSGVRLRSAPSLHGEIYTTIEAGREVNIIENDPKTGWAKINIADKVGYVSAQFLQPIQKELVLSSFREKNNCSFKEPYPSFLKKTYRNIDNTKGEVYENLTLSENIDLKIVQYGCNIYKVKFRFLVKDDQTLNMKGAELYKKYIELFYRAQDKMRNKSYFTRAIKLLEMKISENDFSDQQGIPYRPEIQATISLGEVHREGNHAIFEAVFSFGNS